MPKNYAQHRHFLYLNSVLKLNPDGKFALKNLKFVRKYHVHSALFLHAYVYNLMSFTLRNFPHITILACDARVKVKILSHDLPHRELDRGRSPVRAIF